MGKFCIFKYEGMIMNWIKRLFCNHDYISFGKYYENWEGDWFEGTPLTYVDVYHVTKCRKCQKIKHKRIIQKRFIGWNANRDYQYYLIATGVTSYDDWLLELLKKYNKPL